MQSFRYRGPLHASYLCVRDIVIDVPIRKSSDVHTLMDASIHGQAGCTEVDSLSL